VRLNNILKKILIEMTKFKCVYSLKIFITIHDFLKFIMFKNVISTKKIYLE